MLRQEIIPHSNPRRAHLPIKVCHLAIGDGWAGAEVQLATLLASLTKTPQFEISAILFNEGRLANELRSLGVNTEVIPESSNNLLSITRQLVRYFRQHGVDILHTHKPKDNVLGALSSAYQGIRHRVRTVHGYPEHFVGFHAVKMNIYEKLDSRINAWLVDRIVAVSLDLKRELIKRFGPEKVVHIPNAIDVQQIRSIGSTTDLKKELRLDGQEFLIGAMGRLTLGKGFESFLQAARIIYRQRPNVKFIVAGDGPLKEPLETKAREYGLDGAVLFLGHREDNYRILKLVDLFVLPSFSEGIPMVLLEALALARPVIASRVGGIPEVIEHRTSGLLVAPGKEDELAQSCMTLMDDYDFARQLGVAGQKRVEERFSVRVMAEKVAEVYRTLVGSEKSR
jgi:glycosyltransferase involved in cell wall biosynthesis